MDRWIEGWRDGWMDGSMGGWTNKGNIDYYNIFITILFQIKNSLLICQINRDLTRRVKNAPPVTWARRVVQSDVQLLLNLIEFLDKNGELWNYSTREEETEGEGEGENTSTENKEPTEEILKVL